MPGIDPPLGAGFIAAVGNDLADSTSPDGLAAFANLAPVPHDFGNRNGNLHGHTTVIGVSSASSPCPP
ncbi:transposase [Streptomyces sp. NRRL F-525]|uniref:transposase n=1 Tax=Streptomyces sp. NRRL F-525 TaxID=1463861 RepID=UPI00068EE8E0